MQRRGQGATEYLVLLAVVLIIGLVGIALLGFFPGTASDAQEQESKIYWQSASPVAITEWSAENFGTNFVYPYLRVRNNGAYPVSITGVIGGNKTVVSVCECFGRGCTCGVSLAGRMAVQPGEEKFFGYYSVTPGLPDLGKGHSIFGVASSPEYAGGDYVFVGSAICSQTEPYGYLVVKDFGFEYQTTIEGQAITKREMGSKPLVIKCVQP